MLQAMTPFPYTIDADANLDDASSMMMEHDIRHLPVVKDGELYGILSQREVELAISVVDGRKVTVAAVATSPAQIVESNTLLSSVAREMAVEHTDAVLCVRDDKLVGILTTVDVCRVLAEVLEDRAIHPGSDAA